MRCRCSVAVLALSMGATTGAQIVNGDFETGSLTPWSIGFTPNGATIFQLVESIDIDGPGPLSPSNAARFGVGNAAPPNQPNQGILVTQLVALTGGVTYTIRLDYAAVVQIGGLPNNDGGRFSIIVDGVPLVSVATGLTLPTIPHYGSLSTPFMPPTSGTYSVGVMIARNFLAPNDLSQYVDNFSLGTATCYPDCNGDGALNLSDFGCYQTRFALGEPYADCNGDGVRNLADFGCFQTKFALGCP
ncbi:MAG: hypothetical protein IT437_05290 [Phycisphaerales bacterium]|nr:hypothetical protein [Phycisphaerales bacterium]